MRLGPAMAYAAGVLWVLGAGVLTYLALVQLTLTGDYHTPDMAGGGVNALAAIASALVGIKMLLRAPAWVALPVGTAVFVGAAALAPLVFGRLGGGALPWAVGALVGGAALTAWNTLGRGATPQGRSTGRPDLPAVGAPELVVAEPNERRSTDAPRLSYVLDRWRTSPIALGLVVGTVIVAATFLRQTGTPKADTMWGEDGPVFAFCAYYRPLLDCLTVPFEGYLHTTPRLAAAIVTVADPRTLPFLLTLVSACIAAACGVLTARAVSQTVHSHVAGLVAGTSFALVLAARIEVSGNLTNVPWIMFSASVVILSCSWLGRRLSVSDLVLLALTSATSPFALALVPIAVIATSARAGRSRWALAAVSVGNVPQLFTLLTSTRTPAGGTPLALGDILRGGLDAVSYWVSDLPVGALVPLIGVGLVAFMIVLHVRQGRASRLRMRPGPTLLGAAAVSIGLIAIGEGVFAASAITNHQLSVRYFYVPSVLMVCALAVCTGVLRRHLAGWAPSGRMWGAQKLGVSPRLLPMALAIVLGVGFASSFYGWAYASPGPNAAAEIAASADQCTRPTDQLKLPISAILSGWYVYIPCSRLIAP